MADDVKATERRAVWIVMATYNGERYLAQQIESIRGQSLADWRLLVRDDGSTDGTVAYLRDVTRNDPRIELLKEPAERLGVCGSFGALLARARARGAEVVFCCDQDDCWRGDKLAAQVRALMAAENQTGMGKPVLVTSDARLVDREGQPLGGTFATKVAGPARGGERVVGSYLLGNRIPGCTLAINRALLELATPLPAGTPIHDWWLAALGATAGRIVWIEEPLVDYRQHGANSIGAPGLVRRGLAALNRWFGSGERSALEAVAAQAVRLAERLKIRGYEEAARPVEEFVAALSGGSRGERRRALRKWVRDECRRGARFKWGERMKLWRLLTRGIG